MTQLSKPFDQSILKKVHINKNYVEAQVDQILKNNLVKSQDNINAWLLQAVKLIDLTTLSGDDTKSCVIRLCQKAANPLDDKLVKALKHENRITTAAVCVYPSRVKDVCSTLNRIPEIGKEIQVAAVATGFPSGLYPLQTRLAEIGLTVQDGATEIDVVIDRSLVLMGKWEQLYNEIAQMRKACGTAHLKVILGVGELGSYENIYKASMIAMMAGADFIKTSTGKETVNATLPVGLVMCRAIRKYYQMTGFKVGLKPAGGIKTAQDAVNWLILVYTELGQEWLSPKLFRIGASSLLDVIEKDLKKYL
ncbi:deoxyribose-phosphate aldolase [Manduca sexta]|uniref:deoxyribose-phosphate aldolase n=1 Tax=Manduca sexta TaxID=7130 RepID=A0A921Z1E5_MANSE|nr:deoxyribose-phosphate aldolase [Manduca sexta]KAG6448546.1 hypothetical protein O3G_MSEX005605 [Manduca sexta]KAG6448547.1 hypothetical protein O3G_MSEX005605 [Manduca sexta]